MLRPAWLLVFPFSLLAADAPARQPVTATDLLKIRQVTAVSLAPDGAFAVYAVRSMFADPPAAGRTGEPTYGYRTHLFRIDVTSPGAQPVQLTFGDRNDGSPVVSPDGSKVAFVRTDAIAKERPRPQLWVLSLAAAGEAQQLTTLEFGASDPLWRPDSKAVLVSGAVPASRITGKPQFALERPEREWFDYDRANPQAKPEDPKPVARPDGVRTAIRNWLEQNANRDNPTVVTRMNFQDEQGLQRELSIPQVWLIELDKDNKATQLTRGFYPHFNCGWSADGNKLACLSWPASNEHPDRVRRTNLVTMTARGGDRRVVLDRPGFAFQNPQWYPDGRALLVNVQSQDQPSFRQVTLARVDLLKEDFEVLTGDWDSSAGEGHFSSDGSILFGTSWHGGFPLKRLVGKSVTDVIPAPAGVTAFDEKAGRLVYALTAVESPNELYLKDKDGSTRRLTSLNFSWLADRQISTPEEHWLTRPDGTKVQYWVMKPLGAVAGKKYPWVLDMHGGPSAMWGPGEFSMWHEFQTFCAWGYGVVYANPRGSSGYGYKFQRANYQNWGEAPSGDVLAALDETLKSQPLVDKDRLFLTGGSYAGYLTAWIVSHDHRFKAAASQRGVYDLTTFYGEGNAYRLVENHFGGFPWEPEIRRILDRESPFSYVDKIRTPLLILHGSQDLRTGVTQSEMLYRALKQQGKPVEYVRYPGIGHELTRSGPPNQRMDHMLRIVEFFERYAHNDRPAPAAQ